MLTGLRGHLWTIAAEVRGRWDPGRVPPEEPWSVDVPDSRYGTVRLRGRLGHHPGADTLLLIVHGLGGSSDSPYALRAARTAAREGLAYVRVDLRGADGSGEDLYHAGLADDLRAVLRALPDYRRVWVVGYSLGGHVALHLAAEPGDPRIEGVAAVCAPLDLSRSSRAFDRARATLYREFVLRHLKGMARQLDARQRLDCRLHDASWVRTIRAWDQMTVVPRFGFDDVDDYYARASVGPRLRTLAVPAAWFGVRGDPMVPSWTVEPSLRTADPRMVVRWLPRGGHVAFPERIEGGRAVEGLVLDFLARAG